MQTAESKDLGKNRKIRDNMLKTKILLKEPVYLSKKKVIGNVIVVDVLIAISKIRSFLTEKD